MKSTGYFLFYTSLLVFELGIVNCEVSANPIEVSTSENIPTESLPITTEAIPDEPLSSTTESMPTTTQANPTKSLSIEITTPKISENDTVITPNTIQKQINHFIDILKLNRVNGTACNSDQGNGNCNQTETTFEDDVFSFLERILHNENVTLTKIMNNKLDKTEYLILGVVAFLNVLIVLSVILFYCCPCLQKRVLGSLSRAAFDMRLYENVRTRTHE